jgi:catechol 2,3-dioxygenase-like lactoylglutathione lyase family enzyme
MIVERYAFVALTTTDLERARRFWVDQLEFSVTEEEPGRHFIVDAGTLRLCVDLADGDVHRSGSTDPVIGFKVTSLAESLAGLATRDVYAHRGPIAGPQGSYAELRDPDGRAVILTEAD